MEYTCEWCGYTGRESEFLSGSCPACCKDNFTGEGEGIPLVFHDNLEKRWEALKEKCKTCEFCERYVSQGKEYQACGGCPEYVELEEQKRKK